MLESVALSITILHYQFDSLTHDCLKSVLSQEMPCSYEVLVIDNGSPTPFIPLPEHKEKIRVVRHEDAKLHIVGQNRCFEAAQGEWVLFVANDVRMFHDAIYWLWYHKRNIAHPTLWTVQRQLDNRGLLWVWPGYGIRTECTGPGSLCYAFTGSCYLMRKTTWHDVGRFDEHLVTSHEDIDFALRAERMGFVIVGIPASRALHLGNATLQHSPSHTRAAFHRDRVYVIRKHYTGLTRCLRLVAVHLLDSLPRF